MFSKADEIRRDAEQQLLCSLLMSSCARDETLWRVKAEHFRDDAHQRIFAAIKSLDDRREPVDPLLVSAELSQRGDLEAVGGDEYLTKIVQQFTDTVPVHAAYHAKLVRELWLKRQAKYGALEVIEAVNADQPLPDVLMKCEATLGAVCDIALPQTVLDIKTVLLDAMQDISDRVANGRRVGIPTGFDDLDAVLGGLVNGELTIVAARPSMGKTAFACGIALNLAEAGKSVLFFSLEMGKLELGTRLLCIASGVDSELVANGMSSLPPSDRELEHDKLLQGASRLQELKLHLDETPNQTLRAIIGLCRRHKRRHGLDCVVIDYLQLIEPEDRKAPREQQVATISRRLKGLAKELQIPVIVLAQINRAVETRTVKKPQLSDLRESGAIEQDSDKVLFLYREDYYSPGNKPGIAEVIVAKNRNGKTHPGIELGWIESRTTFVSRNQIAVTNFAATNRLGCKTF